MRDRGYTILKWSVIALAWLSYPMLTHRNLSACALVPAARCWEPKVPHRLVAPPKEKARLLQIWRLIELISEVAK